MARKAFPQVDLTIPNGQNVSNAADIDDFGVARGFALQSPAALDGTCTVEVSLNGGTDFVPLQSGGVDVTIGSSKCGVIDFMAWDKLRIASDAGGGETPAKIFILRAVREY